MTFVVYSDDFALHRSPGHPERPERAVSAMGFLRSMPFFEELNLMNPVALGEDDILRVHSVEMVSRVKNTVGWLDPDTYVTENSYEIAKLAAGGVVNACNDVLNGNESNGFAIVRPPGHHATKDRSMGFCLFNNVAIAADIIASQGKKVLIFDHDVHHGNGTCDIFYDRKDVLYQSIHLSPHYPGTGMAEEIGRDEGEGFTVNAPLPRGVGDGGIEKLLDEIMIPIAEQFSPDFIIFSAGFDSHHSDELGGLALTVNFYGEMLKKFSVIQSKIVCVLEGGYKLDVLGKGIASEIAAMLGKKLEFEDHFPVARDADGVIKNLKELLGSYWDL